MRGHGLCGRIRFIWSDPASTESCNPDSRGLDSCGVCGGGAPEKVCWAATIATILIRGLVRCGESGGVAAQNIVDL